VDFFAVLPWRSRKHLAFVARFQAFPLEEVEEEEEDIRDRQKNESISRKRRRNFEISCLWIKSDVNMMDKIGRGCRVTCQL